jgi:RNA polymerase sigma-70 factor (ECF subfamily)
MPDEPEVLGLLALVLLQDSRRAARVGADGGIVLLDAQDRSLWDETRIEEGLRMLERAVSLRRPGPYQLQAAIAAAHAEDRPKAEIVVLYERLLELDPSPVVRLNHAVAVALDGDVEHALELLDTIEGLEGYHLFHAARADLQRRLELREEAALSYAQALELATSEPERRFLERRLAEVS